MQRGCRKCLANEAEFGKCPYPAALQSESPNRCKTTEIFSELCIGGQAAPLQIACKKHQHQYCTSLIVRDDSITLSLCPFVWVQNVKNCTNASTACLRAKYGGLMYVLHMLFTRTPWRLYTRCLFVFVLSLVCCLSNLRVVLRLGSALLHFISES